MASCQVHMVPHLAGDPDAPRLRMIFKSDVRVGSVCHLGTDKTWRRAKNKVPLFLKKLFLEKGM